MYFLQQASISFVFCPFFFYYFAHARLRALPGTGFGTHPKIKPRTFQTKKEYLRLHA